MSMCIKIPTVGSFKFTDVSQCIGRWTWRHACHHRFYLCGRDVICKNSQLAQQYTVIEFSTKIICRKKKTQTKHFLMSFFHLTKVQCIKIIYKLTLLMHNLIETNLLLFHVFHRLVYQQRTMWILLSFESLCFH